MTRKKYYYLSIGSNIDPEKNAAAIIRLLIKRFGPIIMYPFYYTKPENMCSNNIFLNSLAVILTNLSTLEVKRELNGIETTLGRDRRDPDRSEKDRSADIDILDCSPNLCETYFRHHKESYISGLINSKIPRADLSQQNLPPTECAATVDLDAGTGHIRILDNTADRLEYWQKSAFTLQ